MFFNLTLGRRGSAENIRIQKWIFSWPFVRDDDIFFFFIFTAQHKKTIFLFGGGGGGGGNNRNAFLLLCERPVGHSRRDAPRPTRNPICARRPWGEEYNNEWIYPLREWVYENFNSDRSKVYIIYKRARVCVCVCVRVFLLLPRGLSSFGQFTFLGKKKLTHTHPHTERRTQRGWFSVAYFELCRIKLEITAIFFLH